MDMSEGNTGLDADSPEILEGIANALSAESGEPPPQEATQPEAAKPEASEAPEAGEAPDAVPEDQIEIDPDAPLFEVQVAGGDAKKISLSDLQSGYTERDQLRAQNETLQRAASDVQSKVHQAVAPVEQQYRQNLEVLQKAVWNLASRELANVDFSRLAAEDPAEAVRLSARAQEIQGVLQAAQEEIAQTQQKEQQRNQAMNHAQAQKSVETLKRDIPGWGQELYQTVLKTGVDAYGFAADELNSIVDARQIKVLHDAHKYRQLQNSKPSITKRVVSVPKMMKPGTTDPDNSGSSKANALQARFKKSGSVDDFAQLLLVTQKGR